MHQDEKAQLRKTIELRDIEIFRYETAIRSVSAQVVARDAKLSAMNAVAKTQDEATVNLRTELVEAQTKLAHCEDELGRTKVTDDQIKEAEEKAVEKYRAGPFSDGQCYLRHLFCDHRPFFPVWLILSPLGFYCVFLVFPLRHLFCVLLGTQLAFFGHFFGGGGNCKHFFSKRILF